MGETRKNEVLGPQLREEQLRLPFDQYQRYRIIADVVELLREDSSPLQILDVGGGEGIILNFLSDDKVTVLDKAVAEGGAEFAEGDATALPFEAGAFDYVTSVDVYEHIEPESRDRYLSELRRTSRRGVLLAAPFDSEVVRSAERLANEFHRSVHLRENVWLGEHAENGLPSMDVARTFFEGQGDAVYVIPNGYIPHWLAMICLTFYGSKLKGEMGNVLSRVNAFYNEFLYQTDNTEPCYRHLLISLREPVDIELDTLLPSGKALGHTSGSQALFGALSTMLPLATEMKRLNTNLAQKEAALSREQAKLEGALARKEAKLEGALARKEAQAEDLSRRLAERVSAENSYLVQADRRAARLQQDHGDLRRQKDQLQRQKDHLQSQLEGVTRSRAWRLLTVLHKFRLGVAKIFSSG